MMIFDTLIFDLEGVVIDTEPVWIHAATELLARRNIIYDNNKMQPLLIGTSLVEGIRILQQEYGFDGNPKELAKERMEIANGLLAREVNFMPGFPDFYKGVVAVYKTCIATSMYPEPFSYADKKLKLRELFNNNVFSIDEVGYVGKPNPSIFLYAAKQLNSIPERCIVIEDAPNGVEAAKRAGMYCIALTTSVSADKLGNADFIVDSFSQIEL